jgi:hypothetical protein
MSLVRLLLQVPAFLLAAASAPPAAAATQVSNGFASAFEMDGAFRRPTNRIKEGKLGQTVGHWIEWYDLPPGPLAFRCEVRFAHYGHPIHRATRTLAETAPRDGYSTCEFDSDAAEHWQGPYLFTQFLNDEMVSNVPFTMQEPWSRRLMLHDWQFWLLMLFVALAVADGLSRERQGK